MPPHYALLRTVYSLPFILFQFFRRPMQHVLRDPVRQDLHILLLLSRLEHAMDILLTGADIPAARWQTDFPAEFVEPCKLLLLAIA